MQLYFSQQYTNTKQCITGPLLKQHSLPAASWQVGDQDISRGGVRHRSAPKFQFVESFSSRPIFFRKHTIWGYKSKIQLQISDGDDVVFKTAIVLQRNPIWGIWGSINVFIIIIIIIISLFWTPRSSVGICSCLSKKNGTSSPPPKHFKLTQDATVNKCQASGPSREWGRGVSYPGPTTFGGPAVAQKYIAH